LRCGTDDGGVTDLSDYAVTNGSNSFTGDQTFTGNILMGKDKYIGISGAERIVFDGGSNQIEMLGASVGVGYNNPTHTFHVEGTVNITRAAGQPGGIEVDSSGNVIIRLG
jgi:hypothetical protein